jgi:hypothetical protein
VGDKKYQRISANIYNTPEEYQKLCSGANDQSIMAAQKTYGFVLYLLLSGKNEFLYFSNAVHLTIKESKTTDNLLTT